MHHQKYRTGDGKFKEVEAAYKAKYRAENREKSNEYARVRWATRPEARFDNALWKIANREKINERQRVANMSEEQIAKQKESRRRTYIKHRDDRIVRAKSGSAARKGAVGKYTKSDIEKIIRSQDNLCAGCSIALPSNYHIDHILPISRGGTNWPDNLQCMCPRCNMSKGALTMEEWRNRGDQA